MNKKGFTLVELLAVIVILALLALLTSTAVTKLVKDAKDDLSDTQIQLIKSAADTWIADNINRLPSSGSCGYLTLEDLKYYGLLDNTILDPKNSEEILNDLKIKITTTTSAYGNPVSKSEVNPESIEGCSQIYYPFCTIAEDSTIQGLNAGAKYNCKVDPNRDPYIFYVLTSATENSATVNMIMDSNIRKDGTAIKEENPTDKGLVEWMNETDYNIYGGPTNEQLNDDGRCQVGGYCVSSLYGPITVLNHLESATATWTNLIPMTIKTFDDYTGSTHNIAKTYNMYARLPYRNEIYAHVSTRPEWLSTYLNPNEDYQNRPSSKGVSGYWTLTAYETYEAFYVNQVSAAVSDNLYMPFAGVRPVISVPINRIIQTNQ